MRKFPNTHWLGVLLVSALAAGLAWGEMLEMVTYYPSPSAAGGDFDRLHANRATIGAAYNRANVPDADVPDGNLFVSERVGIGTAAPTGPLHVVGEPDTDSIITFLPSQAGNGTGTVRFFLGHQPPGPLPAHKLFVFDQEPVPVPTQRAALGVHQRSTGLGMLYAGFFRHNGTGPDNIGIRAEAVGGTRNAAVLVPRDNGGVSVGFVDFGAGTLAQGTPPNNGLIVAGNVGIGTATPGTCKLSILQAATNPGQRALCVQQTGTANGTVHAGWFNADGASRENIGGRFEAANATNSNAAIWVPQDRGGVAIGYGNIPNGDSNPPNNGLIVRGNVGIGIAAPRTPAPNTQAAGNLDVNDVWLRSAGGGAGAWLSAAAGGAAARYVRTTAQTIPNGSTSTLLLLNSETFDTANLAQIVGGGISIQQAGTYLVTASWAVQLPPGTEVEASIRVNGVARTFDRQGAVGTTTLTVRTSDLMQLAVGDVVELRVSQYSGGNRSTLTGGSDMPRLTLVRVAP